MLEWVLEWCFGNQRAVTPPPTVCLIFVLVARSIQPLLIRIFIVRTFVIVFTAVSLMMPSFRVLPNAQTTTMRRHTSPFLLICSFPGWNIWSRNNSACHVQRERGTINATQYCHLGGPSWASSFGPQHRPPVDQHQQHYQDGLFESCPVCMALRLCLVR